MLSYMKVK